MDLDSKPSNQLLLESDVFTDTAAVDDGIWVQATCDDGPLRQDTYRFFVR